MSSQLDKRSEIISLANEVDQIGEALMSTNKIRGMQLVSLGHRIALSAPASSSLASKESRGPMLLEVIRMVRCHPDFDQGGPMAEMMDQALAGAEHPDLLAAAANLQMGRKPPEPSAPAPSVGATHQVPASWVEFSLAVGETPEGITRRALVNIASISPLSTASPQEIAKSALAAAHALSAAIPAASERKLFTDAGAAELDAIEASAMPDSEVWAAYLRAKRGLDRAAYALFQVKRLVDAGPITQAFAREHHGIACAVYDALPDESWPSAGVSSASANMMQVLPLPPQPATIMTTTHNQNAAPQANENGAIPATPIITAPAVAASAIARNEILDDARDTIEAMKECWLGLHPDDELPTYVEDTLHRLDAALAAPSGRAGELVSTAGRGTDEAGGGTPPVGAASSTSPTSARAEPSALEAALQRNLSLVLQSLNFLDEGTGPNTAVALAEKAAAEILKARSATPRGESDG